MYAIGHIFLYVALVIGLSLSQQIIFEDDSLTRKPAEPVRIPETLLVKLDSVQNVPEFLRKFVESKETVFPWLAPPPSTPSVKFTNSSETPAITSRKGSSRTRGRKLNLNPNDISIPYGIPAKCQPELQVVSLQKPVGNVIHWPSCIRVRRCGGCCGGTLKACTPVQASLYNLTVIEASYDPNHPDYFQHPKEVVVSVEQHTKCACTCRHQANNCGRMQRFDEDNCKCVCRDRSAQCPPHMVWDGYHCRCKCREKAECSTGRFFNVQECRCEEFSSALRIYLNDTSSKPDYYEMRIVPSKDKDIPSLQTL